MCFLTQRCPARSTFARAAACWLACACGSGSASSADPDDSATPSASTRHDAPEFPPLVSGAQAESARPEPALQLEIVSTNPEQQRKGYNAFTVRFSDLSGAPYEPAVARVIPWMPSHGHGTSVAASAHPGTNGGEWVLDDLNLFMPSYWKVYVFVCGAAEERCCDANAEPCAETSDSLVDTLFFKVWIPS
jgi:hypothetical protein